MGVSAKDTEGDVAPGAVCDGDRGTRCGERASGSVLCRDGMDAVPGERVETILLGGDRTRVRFRRNGESSDDVEVVSDAVSVAVSGVSDVDVSSRMEVAGVVVVVSTVTGDVTMGWKAGEHGAE